MNLAKIFRQLLMWNVLWFTIWLGSFASASENPIEPTKRIVILGDSITAGYGLDSALAYPALLQKKINEAALPYQVINAGVSGDTTAGGLRRIDWVMGEGADILIIALGGNDGLRGISPPYMHANLNSIIQRARLKSPNIKILIAGMQMPGSMGESYIKQFAAIFPKVASQNKAVLIPFLLEGVGGIEKYNQSDLIHPTAEGQKKIAETVWNILAPILKKNI